MESDKKYSLFIVDDDSFLLDMYALKFSQSNFTVTTALGSLPALQKLQEGFVPDVMLLDIVMPVMDGFELLEKMNAEKLALNAVRVILSNRGQQSDVDRGRELGASGYIVKANATPAEVVEKVNAIIKEKQTAK
jgi:DNA-binding response OmpR family regulator